MPKLVSIAHAAPWTVTREVFDELANVPGRASVAPLVRAAPLVATREAALSSALMAGVGWAGLGVGESASIAAAAVDPALTFVTWDRAASWRSLHELCGRTEVGHAWLVRLVDLGLLQRAEADTVARADPTRRHPSWWW